MWRSHAPPHERVLFSGATCLQWMWWSHAPPHERVLFSGVTCTYSRVQQIHFNNCSSRGINQSFWDTLVMFCFFECKSRHFSGSLNNELDKITTLVLAHVQCMFAVCHYPGDRGSYRLCRNECAGHWSWRDLALIQEMRSCVWYRKLLSLQYRLAHSIVQMFPEVNWTTK